jgi:hypothetical protein
MAAAVFDVCAYLVVGLVGLVGLAASWEDHDSEGLFFSLIALGIVGGRMFVQWGHLLCR